MRRVAVLLNRKLRRQARQLRGLVVESGRSAIADGLVLVGAGAVLYGVDLIWTPAAFVLGGAAAIAGGLTLAPRTKKGAGADVR